MHVNSLKTILNYGGLFEKNQFNQYIIFYYFKLWKYV